MPTTDGLIKRVPEAHCFGCGQGALGLCGSDPQKDLRERGWVKIKRRWHCHDCAKERGSS